MIVTIDNPDIEPTPAPVKKISPIHMPEPENPSSQRSNSKKSDDSSSESSIDENIGKFKIKPRVGDVEDDLKKQELLLRH